MSRIHPPDILHTLIHGTMEYSLGFALQIIKLISSLDRSGHGRSCKLLEDAVRKFPTFNPFNPVRHVHFENVWEVVPSSNSNVKGKPSNTSNVVVMKDYSIQYNTYSTICCKKPLEWN